MNRRSFGRYLMGLVGLGLGVKAVEAKKEEKRLLMTVCNIVRDRSIGENGENVYIGSGELQFNRTPKNEEEMQKVVNKFGGMQAVIVNDALRLKSTVWQVDHTCTRFCWRMEYREAVRSS